MLYNVVVNDWGETTYVPTALGNVLLVTVLIALLAVAVVFARKHRNKTGADDGDRKMAHSKLTVKQLAFALWQSLLEPCCLTSSCSIFLPAVPLRFCPCS